MFVLPSHHPEAAGEEARWCAFSTYEFIFYIFFPVYNGATVPEWVSHGQFLFHINDTAISDLPGAVACHVKKNFHPPATSHLHLLGPLWTAGCDWYWSVAVKSSKRCSASAPMPSHSVIGRIMPSPKDGPHLIPQNLLNKLRYKARGPLQICLS